MQKRKKMERKYAAARQIPVRVVQVLMLFALVLGIGVLFPGKAQAATQGYWEYSAGSSGATITRYTGGESNVVIPSTLGNQPVVALGGRAFAENNYIVTVTIPSTVTSINYWGCFMDCTSLTTVYGLEYVQYIGEEAFEGCTSLTNLSFGGGLTDIGREAFSGCTNLRNFVLPSSLTKIDSYAFKNCDSLTSVTIPSSVTELGYESFRSCDSLKTVSLQASLEDMGRYVFTDCKALTTVSVGGTVKTIGNNAFEGCTALTSVSLGEGVRTIGESAFNGCTSLPSISIPGSVRSIGVYGFSECNSLSSVQLNYGLTEIGHDAFKNCTLLSSINVPNSVTYIGRYAFAQCTQLTSAFLPNSVSKIDDDNGTWYYIFENCPVTITCYPGSYAETWVQKVKEKKDVEYTLASAIPSTSFNFSSGTIYLMEDQMVKIGYAIAPSNTTDAIVWESSASDIASVNAIGEVTAKKAGSATIIAATTSGIRKDLTVVVSYKPTKLTFSTSEKTIEVGKTYTQTATVSDRNGVRTDIKPDYSSSNPSIATVNANGKVKGVAPGVVTITAKTSGLTATYKVTVVKASSGGSTAAKKTIKKLQVKKSGKVLKITTIKGAKVKVTAKKAFLGKASKTVKVNSKGVAKIKFKKKIKKVTVKIKVTKSGYKAKTLTKKY